MAPGVPSGPEPFLVFLAMPLAVECVVRWWSRGERVRDRPQGPIVRWASGALAAVEFAAGLLAAAIAALCPFVAPWVSPVSLAVFAGVAILNLAFAHRRRQLRPS